MSTRKIELKVAKANHRLAMKNRVKFLKERDTLLMRIIESPVPSWGGIKISVTKVA